MSDEPDPGSRSRPARTVLLAIGSNIEPEKHIVEAITALDELLGVDAASAIYEADPVGAPGTPQFLNAAVRITTNRTLRELKYSVLRPLEAEMGRTRGSDPNAPRTIDLDIAAVEGLVATHPELTLPDPDLGIRAHLAVPLADVAPNFVHPILGLTLAEIADAFRDAPDILRREDLKWPEP